MDKNTLTPYEKVLTARKQDRPNITEYIEALFDEFIEMHGDRLYKDDKSIVGGDWSVSRNACDSNRTQKRQEYRR